MPLLLSITTGEQVTQSMAEKLDPDRKWGGSLCQGAAFVRSKISDRLSVQSDGLLERREYVLERSALDGDVEVDADRLPLTIVAFSIATKLASRQNDISMSRLVDRNIV